uniref:Uncharacterized protein n=1 Tax=Spongospora subterranea TaxID=70186 RepID=A0A0H5R956_9EUKA|eukprot:CRZ10242.1 hypothetical protein [Spongospora subterranea]
MNKEIQRFAIGATKLHDAKDVMDAMISCIPSYDTIFDGINRPMWPSQNRPKWFTGTVTMSEIAKEAKRQPRRRLDDPIIEIKTPRALGDTTPLHKAVVRLMKPNEGEPIAPRSMREVPRNRKQASHQREKKTKHRDLDTRQ